MMVNSPACPYSLQVGGLGDVVTSLSRAVQDLGHTVDVVLPKYNCMNLSNVRLFCFLLLSHFLLLVLLSKESVFAFA